MLKYFISIMISVSFIVFYPEMASAWGPGVHVVSALGVLSDLSAIVPFIAGVLSAYPKEYMYGCLASDFFIGKSKKKKTAHAHNWTGAFRLLSEAHREQDAAYAYGCLSHLAADVVAHNFFVPHMLYNYTGGIVQGHLYWEMRADYLVGPVYISIARDVLRGDHQDWDDSLSLVAGEKGGAFRAKKRFYTQSIKFYNYFNVNRPSFLLFGEARDRLFHEYISYMVSISCTLVKDFLAHPETSECIRYDPLGKENLLLARKKTLLSRAFQMSNRIRSG